MLISISVIEKLYFDFLQFDHASLEDQPVKPDWKYLDRLGQAIRGAMQLDLFGFDVIINSESMQYGIIDINFFPGMTPFKISFVL